jgi:hypothetical protein
MTIKEDVYKTVRKIEDLRSHYPTVSEIAYDSGMPAPSVRRAAGELFTEGRFMRISDKDKRVIRYGTC